MDHKKHILLVEDDESMGFLLQDSLENYGYQVTHKPNGMMALAEFKRNTFHLCLLDVMMPQMDGFTLAEEIRQLDLDIPIIFLTAKAMKEDRIKGFRLGADDYVTKPFSVEELDLRMQAIFKRGQVTQVVNSSNIEFANYHLNRINLILDKGTEKVQLTQKESDILALFATQPNTLLKRSYILNSVWKEDGYFVGRSLDVFISKLRKYLKDNKAIRIVNIHGSGYKFEVTK